MKNLLIYISPTGSFDNPRSDLTGNDAGQLVKVQIENSRMLGWKEKDIWLYTNFEFQYGTFKAKVLKRVEFFERKPQASKINAIIKLFGKGVIRGKELYWFHDLDAFQLEPIKPSEIKLKNNEIAVTEYAGVHFMGKNRLSTGSIFFKSGSKDIFQRMKEIFYEKNIDEEEALSILMAKDPKIRKRVKLINVTYNFIGYHFRSSYAEAIKPLKVAHFHPAGGLRRAGIDNCLRFFMGANKLNTPLIPDRLIRIFKYHRISPPATA